MQKKRFHTRWLIPVLVLIIILVACGSETQIVQPTMPLQPSSTAILEATAPPTEEPEVLPEPEAGSESTPVEDLPEISQPVARWNMVSEQGNWVLVAYGDALNPTIVESGTYVTINFRGDGQVSGSSGCNDYFTSYTADDDGSISIDAPIGATLLACESGMEQEIMFLNALDSVSDYSITENGQLQLDYDRGKVYAEQLLFVPEADLADTLWVLSAYGDPDNLIRAEDRVLSTVIFSADGTLKGNSGCNNYSAGYQVRDNQITIDLPISNLKVCVKGMDQEKAFLQLLGAAQSFRLGVNSLEIAAGDGTQVMRFNARHLPLENVRWSLAAVDGRSLPEGVSASLLFTPSDSPAATGEENLVAGEGGCNTFSGLYEVSGEVLSLGPLAVTQMICEEQAMQVDKSLLAGLENARNFSIISNQLTILTESGSLLFYADRLPLEGPRWILTGIGPIDNPQPPAAGSAFTAEFTSEFGMPSGVKSGETGCNDYSATYSAGLDEIKVNLPETSRNTCSQGQTEAEQGYFLGLNTARDYRILGNEMQIFYDDGMLFFVGTYAASTDVGGGPLTALNGTRWVFTSIDTTRVIPDSEVNILFDINADGHTGRITGSSGCNSYNARIEEVFSLSPIIVTTATCDQPEGVMQQEVAYITALQNAKDIWVTGDRLGITTDQETLYFTLLDTGPGQPETTPGAPQAVIVAPGDVIQGQKMTFDGSLSTPADQITAYRWWFSDETTAEGVTVERRFASTGFYDAILTITTASGEKSEASVKVSIHYSLIGPVWIADGGITLIFKDGVLSGNAGCNDYSAGYTAEMDPGGPNVISLSDITTTGKICDDESMNREQLFLTRLRTASSYTINIKSLIITTKEGSLTFNGVPASP